jgi:hypothetical protein
MKFIKRRLTNIFLLVFLIILAIALFSSCSTYKPARKVWKCELQPLGNFDTCYTIKENFFKGTTTIIQFTDDSCVCIWGKKCDFDPLEVVYAKPEFWGSIGRWKYFAVNQDQTKRYTLLDRR